MIRWLQNRGLNFKVALGITMTLVIVLGAIFIGISQYIQARLWESEIQKTENINAMAATLLQDAMLAGRKDTVDTALSQLGQAIGSQQLDSIAVYDDRLILTSFASGFPGSLPVKQESMPSSIEDPSCWGCHQLPPEGRPTHLVVNVEGREVIRNSVPLYNEERCQACHGTGKKVLGDVLVDYSQDQFKQSYTTIALGLGGGVILAIGLVILVLYQFMRRIVLNPVEELVVMADAMSHGALDRQMEVRSSDEIGILGRAFNSMASQLHTLIGSLEQKVAERTKSLATVAEVSTTTATILETDKLLQAVVDLTKERFNLYHSHIYLLDEAGENLVLAAGAGEPGRQMMAKGLSIPLDREQSLVARAARERNGVTVNDVTQAPDFLPNPLLPDTRSELAVPMITGGNMIGVFDVQSDVVGRFTDADINIQTTLAAQLAISIQNVRSFEQAKTRADFESHVSAIGQKIQRATSVDDTLQTAIREISLALGASRVKASIGRHNDGDNGASQN